MLFPYLAGPGQSTALQTPLGPEAAERIRIALGHTHAEKTKDAYALAWRQFEEWAEAHGLPTKPSTPETVAGYLTERAERVRMSSLTIAVAAIQTAHRARGLQSPISDDIRLLMKGLRRMLAKQGRTEEKQARPLTEEDLKAIVATAKRPRQLPSERWETKEKAKHRGALDIALACVMRDAGLRRGEAAALQWGDITRLLHKLICIGARNASVQVVFRTLDGPVHVHSQ